MLMHRTLIALVGAFALSTTLGLSSAAASSSTTPGWYPSVERAEVDASDTSATVARCLVPKSSGSKAGRACAMARASAVAVAWNEVSVYTEIGEATGPCRLRLYSLDRAALATASRALAFATHPSVTTTSDVKGRHAVAARATAATAAFRALRHCLGKDS